MDKIAILTDSIGNPRGFPTVDIVSLEQTFPYILKKNFPEFLYWQLSFGNLTTLELSNQLIGYLSDFNPKYIIIYSGINDCRPEAFSELQKELILKSSFFVSKFLRKHLTNPKLITFRQKYRLKPSRFRSTLKKVQLLFPDSKVLMNQICCSPNYERARPGVKSRINVYNQIIEELYPQTFIQNYQDLISKDGFATDNLHLNRIGHKVVANNLASFIELTN